MAPIRLSGNDAGVQSIQLRRKRSVDWWMIYGAPKGIKRRGHRDYHAPKSDC